MKRIGLVACAATKLDYPAPARDLYISPLFRKASRYAEATYDEWYVLSALHGLVAPSTGLEPYDVTLARMTPPERSAWARRVSYQLDDAHIFYHDLALHAGGHYRRALEQVRNGWRLPMEGMGIGQQLAWYKARGF